MPTQHTVQQGDCIDSIAFEHGFFPGTLWDHPENRELKNLRKDGNILQPGDVICIPDLTVKEEAGATEKKHRFKRRGVPAMLQMAFSRKVTPEEEGAAPAAKPYNPSAYEDPSPEEPEPTFEAIANARYVLTLDGINREGTSDGDGMVKVPIMPSARTGRITFHKGTKDEVSFDLDLGHLDSVDSIAGQRSRLCNLGYSCAPGGEEPDDSLKAALRRFQEEQGLEKTSAADQTTKDKLVELHGS